MDDQLREMLAEFNAPWTRRFARNLEPLLRQAPFQHITLGPQERLMASAVTVLESELNAVSIRAHLDVMDARGTRPGSLDAHRRWLRSEEGRRCMANTYPELVRICDYKVSQLQRLLTAVLNKFDDDFLELRGFGVDHRVEQVLVTSGDPHRGGQRVCILHTRGGRIVFKPRSMLVDSVVGDIAAIINPQLARAEKIHIPRVVDRGEYGWQEYVPHLRCRDLSELADYYTSLGSLTAFFAALGGHDLHYENVTTSRARAVPLDLEAALGNHASVRKLAGGDLRARINRVARAAGAATMILPPLMRSERFDVDLSPITCGGAQQSRTMRAPSLRTDDAGGLGLGMEGSIIEKPVPYPEGCEPAETHPRRYFEHFWAGYERAAQAMRNHTPALLTHLAQTPWIPNRCILRPTSTYAAFLDTSYHPRYLGSADARRLLFSKLGSPPGAPESIGGAAAALEMDALLSGDIPYFTDADLEGMARSAATEAPALEEHASAADFEAAPAAALRSFHAPPGAVRMIQHGAFAGMDPDVWAYRDGEEMPPLFPLDFSRGFAPAALDLADSIYDALIWDAAGGKATMLYQRIGPDDRVRVTPLDFTYFEGQGVVHHLDRAYQHTGRKEYWRALQGLLRTCTEDDPLELTGQQVSSYVDGFSRIRLVPMIRRYLGAERADEFATGLIAAASARLDEAQGLTADYVTGLSGALDLLRSLPPCLALGPLTRMLAPRVAAALREHQPEDEPIGVAHGPIGMVLALATTLAETGIRGEELWRLSKEIYGCQSTATRSWPAGARNSWCKGVPGMLEAHLRVGTRHGEIGRVEWDEARRRFAEFDADLRAQVGRLDLSLCHGAAGALSAWRRIGVLLRDRHLAAGVTGAAWHLLARLNAGEISFGGGVRHASSHLGHMLGLTGALGALSRITTPPGAWALAGEEKVPVA